MTFNTTENKGLFPDVTSIEPVQAIPDALIFTLAQNAGVIKGDSQTARIAYVSDDADADYYKEGAKIEAKAPQVSELIVPTKKIAIVTVASNEAYGNDGVPGLLSKSLQNSIIKKADRAFLSEAAPAEGTVGTTGLANLTGLADGGTLTDSLDPFIDAIATCSQNGGTPSTIVMGFDSWAYLLKLKDKNGRAFIGADVANSATPVLFGLPVVLNGQAAAGTALVLDTTQILCSHGNIELAVSEDAFFSNDATGVRVTFRFGFGVTRPNRIVKIKIGATAKN